MDFLHKIIEPWLGVEPEKSGEHISWNIEHSFPWPPWIVLLFLLATLFVIVFFYRKEPTSIPTLWKCLLAGLRFSLILVALLMLSQLQLHIDRSKPAPMAVLWDHSGSMAIVEQQYPKDYHEPLRQLLGDTPPDTHSRWEIAKQWLLQDNGSFIKSLVTDTPLQLYLVASTAQLIHAFLDETSIEESLDTLQKLEPLDRQSNSRLGDSLRQVLNDFRETPPAGVLFLTDGINTDGESLQKAAEYAKQLQVPIYPLAIGNPNPLLDIQLRNILADEIVFEGDLITFEATVTAQGLEGHEMEAVLYKASSEIPLNKQSIVLGPDYSPLPIRISHPADTPGDHTFELRITPHDQELRTDNNVLRKRVSIRSEKLKVLLTENSPRYEFRYLKHLLERDSSIALNTVLQQADPDYIEEDRSAIPLFPSNREQLFEYDVLIFGDLDPSFLTPRVLRNIADFVQEKGGGLLVIAGPHHTPSAYRGTPLESILPIDLNQVTLTDSDSIPESYKPLLTTEGRFSNLFHFGNSGTDSEQIWDALPDFFWLLETPDLKPGAVPLVVHPSKMGSQGPLPVMVWQFAGTGKVLFHATDDIWRWRFRSGDAYLNHFWIQAIRFLSRSKLVGRDIKAELTTFPMSTAWDAPLQIRVRFFDETQIPQNDDPVEVSVNRDGVPMTSLQLKQSPNNRNVFEGLVTDPGEGHYRVKLTSPILSGPVPTDGFDVIAPPGEMENIQTNLSLLESIAEQTGGKFFTLLNASQIQEHLPVGQRISLETDQPIPLWNRWPVLLLFLSLLICEWLLRKYKRLL